MRFSHAICDILIAVPRTTRENYHHLDDTTSGACHSKSNNHLRLLSAALQLVELSRSLPVVLRPRQTTHVSYPPGNRNPSTVHSSPHCVLVRCWICCYSLRDEDDLNFLPLLVPEPSDGGGWRELRRFGSSLHALFQKAVQGVPNLFKPLLFPPVNDIPDIFTEHNIVLRILKVESLDLLHIIVQLVMLPRDIESCLSTTHRDAERCAINGLDLIALTLSQLLVQALDHVNTGRGTSEALVRCHPEIPTITFELDDEEWIEQALAIRHWLCSHGDKLCSLLRECCRAVVSVK